jgi:transposase-like protein
VTETIEPMAAQIDQQRLAEELVAQAREEGVQLVGEGGLLTGLTKAVVETALEEEISRHLGYDRHDPAGRNGGNSRNGVRSKTVLTEIGPVQIEVPRDRDGSFEPQIVRKRQRRLDGIDQIVLSLTARGLTTGEVAAHFAEVYGAGVSKDTISRITETVVEEMTEWRNRPLDRGRFLVVVANPDWKDRNATSGMEQGAGRHQAPLLRVDPPGSQWFVGLRKKMNDLPPT